MQELALAIGVAAVVALGLSAGALLAEAGVLVPFWRTEAPDSFLAWYRRHASLLLRFFAPLEVSSGALVVVATGLAWAGLLPGRTLFAGSLGLTLAVLATFPLYFKRVNASFAEGSVAAADVGAELATWAAWHRARTLLAVAAFVLAAWALALRASCEEVPTHESFSSGMSRAAVVERFGDPMRSSRLQKRDEGVWGPIEDFWPRVPTGSTVETWSYRTTAEWEAGTGRRTRGTTELYFVDGSDVVSGLGFAPDGVVYEAE